MNAEPHSFPTRRNRLQGCAGALSLLAWLSAATAETTATGAKAGTENLELLQVVERLGPVALAAIAAGALIIVLLVLRIGSMIRRERPVVPPQPRRRASASDRTPMTGSTDWGFDQNKRAALARSVVVLEEKSDGVLSMANAAAMWSASEVQNAAAISMQASEGMGKSPNLPPSPYQTSHNPYFHGEPATRAPIEVTEVADTLLQAELLVQLGDPKQAMILLSQHIRDTEQPGPAVWLMLLDLFQTTGRKSQYEALAVGFKTLFNAAVPAWAMSPETMTRDLETYPQVIEKLQIDWPQASMRPLLQNLLNDNRGGSRQGFSLPAYREILFLLEILIVLEQMTQEDLDRERIQQKLDSAG